MGIHLNVDFRGIQGSDPAFSEAAFEASVEEELRQVKKTGRATDRQADSRNKSFIQSFFGGDATEAKDDLMKSSMRGTYLIRRQSDQTKESLKSHVDQFFSAKQMTNDQVVLSKAVLEGAPSEANESAEDDFDESLIDEDPNSSESRSERRSRVRGAKETRQIKQHIEQFKNPQQSKQGIKDYAKAVLHYVLNPNPNAKEQVNQQHQHLIDLTGDASQVEHIEKVVGQMVYQHYTHDLKRAMLRQVFLSTSSKRELLQARYITNQKVNDIQKLIAQGMIKEDFAEYLNSLRSGLKSDLKAYLLDESTNAFTQTILSSKNLEAYQEQFKVIQKVAKEATINLSEEEVSNHIKRAIDHLGLEKFALPDSHFNSLNLIEGGMGEGSQDDEPKPFNYLNQEQLLEEKLRDVYMQLLMDPNLKSVVELNFEMRKLKNGLYRLGVFSKEEDLRLKKEAAFLAECRLIDLLKNAFFELASLEPTEAEIASIYQKELELKGTKDG